MTESISKSKPLPMNFTLPAGYSVKGTPIPARLTLQERKVFVQNLGIQEDSAALLAMQDRSAALITVLMKTIEGTGNKAALDFANTQVQKWNEECNALFL